MNIANKLEKDGFAVVENFLSQDECFRVRREADQLLKAFDPDQTSTIFKTTELHEARDAYFLESGDRISFFWEEKAFDSVGKRLFSKEKGINKIGHALHDLNPVFDEFSRSSQIKSLMFQDLKWQDPLLLQSMYIYKNPIIGGEVGWHQDQSYLFSDSGAVLGLWFALEDSHQHNGCLWAIPGGHRGPLRKRFRRKNWVTRTEVYDDSPWEEENKIPLEVPQGSVILLHGLLPHKSEKNSSSESRHALTLHLMERHWSYASDNWLQRNSTLPFRGF